MANVLHWPIAGYLKLDIINSSGAPFEGLGLCRFSSFPLHISS